MRSCGMRMNRPDLSTIPTFSAPGLTHPLRQARAKPSPSIICRMIPAEQPALIPKRHSGQRLCGGKQTRPIMAWSPARSPIWTAAPSKAPISSASMRWVKNRARRRQPPAPVSYTHLATPREGRRFSDCKPLSLVTIMTVAKEEATANYVPAAAVLRRWQALSGFTGCKGSVGGNASRM